MPPWYGIDVCITSTWPCVTVIKFHSTGIYCVSHSHCIALQKICIPRMSSQTRPRVAVVGAGVIGLSTAVCLAETFGRQLDITIIAEHFSPDTTSDRAAAAIMPFTPVSTSGAPDATRQQDELLARWFKSTADRCQQIYNSPDRSTAGVYFTPGYGRIERARPYPSWPIRTLSTAEAKQAMLPFSDSENIYSFSAFFVRPNRHLPWLMSKFQENGGLVERRKIDSLSELEGYDVIINCSGLGARKLVGDESVYSYRGQMVVLRNTIGLQNFWINSTGGRIVTEVFPYEDVVIVGTVAEPHDYSKEVDPETTEEILRAATELVPAVKDADVIDTYSCLRPYRSVVRLEVERLGSRPNTVVVHCYGHGGQGWTMHWGCALDVAALVERELTSMGLLKHSSWAVNSAVNYC